MDTAVHLLKPTFSFKKKGDIAVTQIGATNAKVKAYIRFKREKQYQKNMQQSSVVPQTNTATAPLTMPNQVVQPVAQMASNQTAVPPVATQTADPVTTRQRIIENDEFLKDLA